MKEDAFAWPGVPQPEDQNPSTLNLPEPPDYACRRLNETITVDGRLDEECWKQAEWLEPFVDMEDGAAVKYDTQVDFLWDDDAFYAGFWCAEPRQGRSDQDRNRVLRPGLCRTRGVAAAALSRAGAPSWSRSR